MTEYIFKNNAQGALNAAIGTADVSFALESGDGALFPSPTTGQAFHIKVVEGGTTEWMLCTTRSSDTLTVTRAAAPHAFSAGADVYHMLHEDALNSFHQKGSERTVLVTPNGSLAAVYAGEEVYDSVTGIWWKHTTSTTWKAMNS